MLRDILGEEQEDPACLWIQQVNTEGGHSNIWVPISKIESLTNRAHNLCHDNRQLIVIAINRNCSAIKINCN